MAAGWRQDWKSLATTASGCARMADAKIGASALEHPRPARGALAPPAPTRYPASTVLLARVLLKERMACVQVDGVVLAALAFSLVAMM